MNFTTSLLVSISLANLILGLFAWQMTSSRPLILNMLFASAAFLISAYGISVKHPGPLTFVMPFLVTMLVMGRAIAIYWRAFQKGEQSLRAPAHCMGCAVSICAIGTYISFINL